MIDKNFINIEEKDFKKICEKFPHKLSLIKNEFKKIGPKYRLHLSDLDLDKKTNFGDDLVNHLYKKAYSFDFQRYTQYYFQLNKF